MLPSLDEKLNQAISFFKEASGRSKRDSDRALYAHLEAMASGMQENRRLLDFLQTRLEEIHHALGSR